MYFNTSFVFVFQSHFTSKCRLVRRGGFISCEPCTVNFDLVCSSPTSTFIKPRRGSTLWKHVESVPPASHLLRRFPLPSVWASTMSVLSGAPENIWEFTQCTKAKENAHPRIWQKFLGFTCLMTQRLIQERKTIRQIGTIQLQIPQIPSLFI